MQYQKIDVKGQQKYQEDIQWGSKYQTPKYQKHLYAVPLHVRYLNGHLWSNVQMLFKYWTQNHTFAILSETLKTGLVCKWFGIQVVFKY